MTLQISSKGIKLVADSVRHLVPSHAVTYVSQGRAPDDDIVSVIMLLYNPITKCPVHLHAYRCDSVDTANSLREHFQALVDLPHNQKKIRELERRLHAHGLYPGLSSSSRSHSSRNNLLKSVDTGIAGSNRNRSFFSNWFTIAIFFCCYSMSRKRKTSISKRWTTNSLSSLKAANCLRSNLT